MTWITRRNRSGLNLAACLAGCLAVVFTDGCRRPDKQTVAEMPPLMIGPAAPTKEMLAKADREAEREAADGGNLASLQTLDAAAIHDASRPGWWMRAPRLEEGRIYMTAEALGQGVLATKRAAVEAGRRLIEQRQGQARDFRVERASMALLPEQQGGGADHTGYVMVSALAQNR